MIPDGSGAFLWYADDLLTRGEQELLDALEAAVGRFAREADGAVVAAAAAGRTMSRDAPSGFCAEVVEMLRSQQ